MAVCGQVLELQLELYHKWPVCTVIEKRHENIQKCHSALAILVFHNTVHTHLYLMYNLCGSSVSDHIGSMDHHIEIIQKRCRVCGGTCW